MLFVDGWEPCGWRCPASCSSAAAALCSSRSNTVPWTSPVPTQSPDEPTRTRLILKDGSYQLVYSYKVVGDVVRYRSAERDGEEEDIPLALVDMPATEKWKKDHEPGANAEQTAQTPVISPELAKEEAARAALTPEVAPDLRLPEEDSVLALDTFRGTPELVPMPQSSLRSQQGDGARRAEGHHQSRVQPHRITDIPRERADVQLHVPDPVFYVRINGGRDEEPVTSGGTFTVDTHGASGRATPSGGDPNNGYIIERVDVRADARIVDSLRIAWLGTGRPQHDIIEMRSELLPGGHWMKLTPAAAARLRRVRTHRSTRSHYREPRCVGLRHPLRRAGERRSDSPGGASVPPSLERRRP